MSWPTASQYVLTRSYEDANVFIFHVATVGHLHGYHDAICVLCLDAQSCPTLCDPMDCCPPGSSVHGISQARILEWVAMPSSRGSSRSRDRTHLCCISCIGRRILYHCITWEAHESSTGHSFSFGPDSLADPGVSVYTSGAPSWQISGFL